MSFSYRLKKIFTRIHIIFWNHVSSVYYNEDGTRFHRHLLRNICIITSMQPIQWETLDLLCTKSHYSETSDKGHSERGQTSERRTNQSIQVIRKKFIPTLEPNLVLKGLAIYVQNRQGKSVNGKV